MKLKKKNGQSVVEVLVALSVAIVAIVALVKMSSRSIQSSGVAKRQSQGVTLASKITEVIRARKESLGWDTFRSTYPAGSYCYDFAETFPTPAIKASGCAENSGFANNINISYVTPTPSGPLTLNAQVTVTGDESGRTTTTTQALQLVRGYWVTASATPVAPPTLLYSPGVTGLVNCGDVCATNGFAGCAGNCTATYMCGQQTNISWEVSKLSECLDVGNSASCDVEHFVPASYMSRCCCR